MQRKLIGISVSTLLFAMVLAVQSQTTGSQSGQPQGGPEAKNGPGAKIGSGAIQGTVQDQTGAVIPNAPLQLEAMPTGATYTGASSSTGNYRFAQLAAGEYRLRVSVPGFKNYLREKIAVAEGQTVRADVTLEVGTMNETVTVTSSAALLKTENGDISYQIRGDQLNNLPVLAIGAAPASPRQFAASQMSSVVGYPGGAVFSVNGLPDAEARERYEELERSRRFPSSTGSEQYGHYVENEFTSPDDEPLSTFATDVDTASYANIRRFLNSNQLPPADSVRIEELINYFRYDYPLPERGKPVSVTTHLMRSPWHADRQLLHVGLRTTPIATEDLPASHLTFLIDVSGSMASPDKLPLVQQSLQMLTRQLRPQDTVALAVYAGAAGVVLPPTRGDHQQEILNAIGRLQAGGSTAGAAGIRLAYKLARDTFSAKANNRVILATDGDFNVGVSSDEELVRLIEQERKSGVFLSVLGFGTGNLKDAKMEKLADHGNGNYAYIDTLAEARKVFVEEMGATLVTVAKDVKVQIEFNPERVKEYRLVGYENRLLRPEDFNNDAKDAGDMGAGHQVTAFYEIIPADGASSDNGGTDRLRYQRQREEARPASRGNRPNEVAWLKLRYKEPQADNSKLLEWPVNARVENFDTMPRDVRFAVAVAEYGMLLRHSKFAGNASFDHVMRTANDAMGQDLDGYRADFVDLVRRAANLNGAVISRR